MEVKQPIKTTTFSFYDEFFRVTFDQETFPYVISYRYSNIINVKINLNRKDFQIDIVKDHAIQVRSIISPMDEVWELEALFIKYELRKKILKSIFPIVVTIEHKE